MLDRHTAINEKNMKCFKLILMTFLLYSRHATSWFTVHLLLFYSYCYPLGEENHLIFASALEHVIRGSYHLPKHNMLIAV